MNKIKQWFAGLGPDKQRKFTVGAALGLLMLAILVGVMATDDSGKPAAPSTKKKKIETSILTGRDPKQVGLDQILASQKRLETELEQTKRKLQMLENQSPANGRGAPAAAAVAGPNGLTAPAAGSDQVPGPDGPRTVSRSDGSGSVSAPAVTPVAATQKAVQEAVGGSPGSSPQKAPAPALPPPSIPGANADAFSDGPAAPASAPSAAPPPPPKPSLRVLQPRNEGRQALSDTSAVPSSTYTQGGAGMTRVASRGSRSEPEYFVPLGSIISGTLLTGVDAPTSGSHARKDPFPSLLRIKHEVILPNNGLLDLRDCLLVASAYGELSSERVYMRAEGISCQRGDGAIIEASIDAYASGSDGKAGIGGRVVEKTGQLVARSLAAGFIGGLADAFKPSKSQPVTVNPQSGTQGTFQYPDPQYVIGTGVLSGASEAASRIGSIYDELAKQIVPVIEVNAGIPVDFILTRGVTLRFKKVGEISGTTARGPAAAGGQRQQSEPLTSLAGTVGGGFSVQQGPGSSTPAPAPSGANNTFVGRR